MSNFLLTPSNFKDDKNNTPPSYFSENKFIFTYSNNGSNTLTNVIQPVSGDIISFNVILNSQSSASLVVNINNEIVYNQALVQNINYTFTSAALKPTDIVTITLTYPTGSNSLNVWLTPSTEITTASGTYSLKSFMSFGSMVNNNPAITSAIGELSDISLTFSEDQANYSIGSSNTNNSTSINLTVFSSKDGSGNNVQTPIDYSNELLTMGQWIYGQAITNVFNSDSEVFYQAFLAEFSTVINSLTVGNMIGVNNIYLPEFIIFKFNNAAENVNYTPDNRIKIWFSDPAFQAQYDEYSLKFVTPIPNLDDFFLTSSTVQTKVSSVTMTSLISQVQEYGRKAPYTIVETISFNYNDPLDDTYKLPTNWTFVIYGAAGNNIDIQKELLCNYILANSTHTRDEWVTIFPDIFTSTEFILTPMWNQYSVPNLTLEQGVYSPTISFATAATTALATSAGVGYTNQYITKALSIVGTTYKSMIMLAIGGSENLNSVNLFYDLWPDYMSVPTSSLDFNRMQPNTQGFVSLLYQMFATAETMTDISDIPQGMSRLTRLNNNGQVVSYLVASYENVEYLMVTKQSLVGLMGEINPPNPTIGSPSPSTEPPSIPSQPPVTISITNLDGLNYPLGFIKINETNLNGLNYPETVHIDQTYLSGLNYPNTSNLQITDLDGLSYPKIIYINTTNLDGINYPEIISINSTNLDGINYPEIIDINTTNLNGLQYPSSSAITISSTYLDGLNYAYGEVTINTTDLDGLNYNVPGEINNINATADSNNIYLTWDAATMARFYNIFISTNPGNEEYLTTESINQYVVNNLDPNTQYFFKIQATNDNYDGPISNEFTFNTKTNTTLDSVINTLNLNHYWKAENYRNYLLSDSNRSYSWDLTGTDTNSLSSSIEKNYDPSSKSLTIGNDVFKGPVVGPAITGFETQRYFYKGSMFLYVTIPQQSDYSKLMGITLGHTAPDLAFYNYNGGASIYFMADARTLIAKADFNIPLDQPVLLGVDWDTNNTTVRFIINDNIITVHNCVRINMFTLDDYGGNVYLFGSNNGYLTKNVGTIIFDKAGLKDDTLTNDQWSAIYNYLIPSKTLEGFNKENSAVAVYKVDDSVFTTNNNLVTFDSSGNYNNGYYVGTYSIISSPLDKSSTYSNYFNKGGIIVPKPSFVGNTLANTTIQMFFSIDSYPAVDPTHNSDYCLFATNQTTSDRNEFMISIHSDGRLLITEEGFNELQYSQNPVSFGNHSLIIVFNDYGSCSVYLDTTMVYQDNLIWKAVNPYLSFGLEVFGSSTSYYKLFKGCLGHVSIYNSQFTQSQINECQTYLHDYLPALSDFDNAILNSNPVAYYPMSNLNNGICYDYVDNKHLTNYSIIDNYFMGNPSLIRNDPRTSMLVSNSVFGYPAGYTGINNNITTLTNNFTFSVWIQVLKNTTTPGGAIMGGGGYGWGLSIDLNFKIHCDKIGYPQIQPTNAALQLNQIYNLTVTVDNNGYVDYYINGAHDSRASTPNLFASRTDGFSIGCYNYYNYYAVDTCAIQKVAVWNRVLTSNEIRNIWLNGSTNTVNALTH